MAPALNLIDDQRPDSREAALRLLADLEAKIGLSGAARIGLTGAPGAGKSTLLDALVRQRRSHEQTLGIIAVDPSSQRTGGALLGDRIRVRSGANDPGVFFRSMAARTRLGGLAEATRAGVLVLSAAFDVVLIETVGVGQSEGEIAELVDTLVFVAQPGAGDLLQFMKAGILELPDIFVVNKSDLGALAERTRNELLAGLRLGEHDAGWQPPVVAISARDGMGIEELDLALHEHWKALGSAGLEARRARGRDESVRSGLLSRYGAYGLEVWGGRAALDARLASPTGTSGFALLDELGREIEAALRQPPATD